jgi:hypothetical protein
VNDFLNATNSSSEKITSDDWFNYEEKRYLPAFSIAFPKKPIVISKIDLLGKEGKHYECDTAFLDKENPNIFAKYEVYFVPLPEILLPLDGWKLSLFTRRFLTSLSQKHVIKRVELSEVKEENERTSVSDFIATSAKRGVPLLFAGKVLVFEEKYLYFLLAKPQNLLSKPDFEKFIASFKIEINSL